MLGPWHLEMFDGAIDRRPRHRDRWRPRGVPRPVTIWHAGVTVGPQIIWPPIHVDDQREYVRRVVAAKRDGGALVTVLHRRGATAVVVVDVFGDELTELQEHRIRRLFTACKPPSAYGKIRPWVAIGAGRYGAFTTSAVVREPNAWDYWDEHDRLTPMLEQLERILSAADRELEAAS